MALILIVDDSPTIRKAMRRILEDVGTTVEEAPDGAQALERATRGPALDAVLCDIDMPVMDGLTFVSKLRESRGAPQPPIIMCSTHNSFEKIGDALARGANEYIMKPFHAEIVEEKLSACGVK